MKNIHYNGASSSIKLHHSATTEIWQQQKRSRKIKFEYSIGPQIATGVGRGYLVKMRRAKMKFQNIYDDWAKSLNDNDLLFAYKVHVDKRRPNKISEKGEAIFAELDRRTK